MTPDLAATVSAVCAAVLGLLGARASVEAARPEYGVVCLALAGAAAAVAFWPEPEEGP